MSPAKRSGRFSYLTGSGESLQTKLPDEEGRKQKAEGDSSVERDDSHTTTDSSGSVQEGESPASTRDKLASVPKGEGRMKQERSQLNIRLPTTLKRQASAKAVLEGRGIGEVIEELLREYLTR